MLQRRNPKQSPAKYHKWIDDNMFLITPNGELVSNDICHDLERNPQKYFLFMIYIMETIEATPDTKLKNVFPLRTSMIPKHISIGSESLYHLLFSTQTNVKRKDVHKGGKLKPMHAKIWNMWFKTELKCFYCVKNGHKYTFSYMIETDGVSCSLLLIKKDWVGKISMCIPSVKKSKETYIHEIDTKKTRITSKTCCSSGPEYERLVALY